MAAQKAKPKRSYKCGTCGKDQKSPRGLSAHFDKHPTHVSKRAKQQRAYRQRMKQLDTLPTRKGGARAKPLLKFCTGCGTAFRPTWVYCGGCGHRIRRSSE